MRVLVLRQQALLYKYNEQLVVEVDFGDREALDGEQQKHHATAEQANHCPLSDRVHRFHNGVLKALLVFHSVLGDLETLNVKTHGGNRLQQAQEHAKVCSVHEEQVKLTPGSLMVVRWQVLSYQSCKSR